jgi:hypothetical protein
VGQLGTSDGSGVGWYVAASILSFGLLPLATLASALIVGRTLRAALNRMR